MSLWRTLRRKPVPTAKARRFLLIGVYLAAFASGASRAIVSPCSAPAAKAKEGTAAKGDGEAGSDQHLHHRIVTIAPNSAEIICALGAAERIVGVSKFCVYPPELRSRPRVGGLFDPDLERIVALRPDLVVLRGRSEPVEQLCQELRIPIYLDKTDKLADITTCVVELGRRLGRIPEAEVLVHAFHERLEAVRKRVSGKQRPRVLVTISRQPGRMADILTTGKGTFLDEMLALAGGTNVFGHLDMAYPQVSPEGIITHRPEVIIEFMPEVQLPAALKERILDKWGKLGPIPAVVDRRVYFVTDDNALIPSPRYVEIIENVSRLLHPEDDVKP